MLHGTHGQPQNVSEGIMWLKRVADQGEVENPQAIHESF